MSERDDEQLLALWAAALNPPAEVLERSSKPSALLSPSARARLMEALEAEPYLPFASELARSFALAEPDMRSLLRRLVDPKAWTRGIPPFEAFIDFSPGTTLHPLRAGFVRHGGGARLPLHRHKQRELTYVLAGVMVDGEGRRFGPGDSVDMPVGSVHSIGVPEGESALVALLHGAIEMV